MEAMALLDTGLTISSIPSEMALSHGMQVKRHVVYINDAEAGGYDLPKGLTIRMAGKDWAFPTFRAMDYKRYLCFGKDFLQGHIFDFMTK